MTHVLRIRANLLNPQQSFAASQRCSEKKERPYETVHRRTFRDLALSVFAEKPQSVEIRFCPASAVRTYPLENRRDLQSLLLQNVAVINHGSAPFKIDDIDIELLQSNRVVESRKLNREAVQHIADRGAKLQAAGILQQVGFQFCGTDLIAPSIKLAGATLARDQALLIASQVFAFNGARDTLRVRAHGNVDGHAVEFTGSIPIKSEFATNKYIFPLRGIWYVGNGASFYTGHRWAIPEEFALDIAKIGESGLSHKGDGVRFDDYYAYGADVLAAGRRPCDQRCKRSAGGSLGNAAS